MKWQYKTVQMFWLTSRLNALKVSFFAPEIVKYDIQSFDPT